MRRSLYVDRGLFDSDRANRPYHETGMAWSSGCLKVVDRILGAKIHFRLTFAGDYGWNVTPSGLWRRDLLHEFLRHRPPGSIVVPFGRHIIAPPPTPNDNSVGILLGHL